MCSWLHNSILLLTRQQDSESLQRALLGSLAAVPACLEARLHQVQTRLDEITLQQTLAVLSETGQSLPTQDEDLWQLIDDTLRFEQADAYMCAAISSGQFLLDETSLPHNRLLIPLHYSSKVVALLELMLDRQAALGTLQRQLGLLVEIYQNLFALLTESERDTLTGLFNRRTFDVRLNKMLRAQKKKKQDVLQQLKGGEKRQVSLVADAWLAVIDVDFFKRVNDEHGHVVGDEVLLRLAQKMQNSFRSSDLLFRFGGEEFVVVLEPVSFDMAELALERFRAAVATHAFPLVGRITISIGFARITENDFPTSILDYADKALYFAKDQGRNRVYNYESLLASGRLRPQHEEGTVDLF
jgi:diguanylate cyclase (GGDEF)-like protein